MRNADRLGLAMRARDLFISHVLARRKREATTVHTPAHWQLEAWSHHFTYVEGVLLLPADRSLSTLLDIWSASYKKQLSISWEPGRLWQPPQIANFDARGSWIPLLDLVPPVGQGTDN